MPAREKTKLFVDKILKEINLLLTKHFSVIENIEQLPPYEIALYNFAKVNLTQEYNKLLEKHKEFIDENATEENQPYAIYLAVAHNTYLLFTTVGTYTRLLEESINCYTNLQDYSVADLEQRFEDYLVKKIRIEKAKELENHSNKESL